MTGNWIANLALLAAFGAVLFVGGFAAGVWWAAKR